MYDFRERLTRSPELAQVSPRLWSFPYVAWESRELDVALIEDVERH